MTVYGKQAHASLPELGLNAYRLGSELTLEIDRKLHETFNYEDPLFIPPRSTFEPTKVEPNVGNVNTIPGKHVFYIDCRILLSTALMRFLRSLGIRRIITAVPMVVRSMLMSLVGRTLYNQRARIVRSLGDYLRL